jgi:hypothetical protein
VDVARRLRPVPLPVAVPAHHRWAVARRWVEDRASLCQAQVPVPVVVLVAVPVVVLVAVPVVAPVAVVHHAARDVAVVAARNSSRWTFPPTRPMTQPYPTAWSW